MRTSKWLGATALMGAVLGAFHPQLQSAPVDDWQTIADFQIVEGLNSGGQAINTDLTGTIYTVGSCRLADEIRGGVIVRKQPGGEWEVVETVEAPVPDLIRFVSVVQDPLSGAVYAGGFHYGNEDEWLLLKSDQGGGPGTWTVEERFSRGLRTTCQSVTVDNAGNVYAAGHQFGAWLVRKGTRQADGTLIWSDLNPPGRTSGFRQMAYHPTTGAIFLVGRNDALEWTTMRSLDGGQTWEIVDTFTPSGQSGVPLVTAVHSDGQNTLYAVGTVRIEVTPPSGGKGKNATPAEYEDYLVVRRSQDHGQTWETIDWHHQPGPALRPMAITTDQQGTVYVAVGNADETLWVIRKKTPSSADWVTSDQLLLEQSDWGLFLSGLTVDAQGTVYAVGAHQNAAGQGQWIIRALANSSGSIEAQLQIHRSEDQFMLAWRASANGFALEFTDSLPAAQWTTWPEAPLLLEDHFSIIVEAATGARFFRLRKQ
jgi:hypothetical protein